MEQILGGLLQLGIGGVTAAAVVWFLWHLTTKTIPETQRIHREDAAAARKEAREDAIAARKEIRETVIEITKEFRDNLARIEARSERTAVLFSESLAKVEEGSTLAMQQNAEAMAQNAQAIRDMAEHQAAFDRHAKRNEEHILGIKAEIEEMRRRRRPQQQ